MFSTQIVITLFCVAENFYQNRNCESENDEVCVSVSLLG
jgi:hypothetical protein